MMNNSVVSKQKRGRPVKGKSSAVATDFFSLPTAGTLTEKAMRCARAGMDPIQAYRVNGSIQLKDCFLPQDAFKVLMGKRQIYFFGLPLPGDIVFFIENSVISKVKMVDHFDVELRQMFVVGKSEPEKITSWYSFGRILE